MSLRVLIAEDDAVSNRLLQSMLGKWGYQVIATSNGQEAWDILRRPDGPNLAVLDWTMPRLDGLELCSRVRELPAERGYVYAILLTAEGNKTDALDAIEAGADDFLVKPVNAPELRVRLRAAARIMELQGQLLAAQESLRQEATHDPLTGLWNRSAVFRALERDLARARREQTPVAVLLGDLDYFKRINDTFGHDAGDIALCQTAKRMLSAVRGYDTLGRYGGEEFLIACPGCGVAEASALAERIRRRMADEPIALDQGAVALTISIGVAVAQGDALEALPLIQAADRAMYRAKNAGRDRVEVLSLMPKVRAS